MNMRGLLLFTGFGIFCFGVLLLIISGQGNLTVSTPNFSTAMAGLGFMFTSLITVLLSEILYELKKLNNK